MTRTAVLFQTAALALFASATLASPSRVEVHSKVTISKSGWLRADSLLEADSAKSLTVTVRASATFSRMSELWVYAYTVTNARCSSRALETFAIRPVRRTISLTSPIHWLGRHGTEGDSAAIGWSVVDRGPAPPNWDGVQLTQGPHHPKPGQEASGFSIASREGPVGLWFYAEGFDTLQWGGESGVDSAPGLLAGLPMGVTIGPGGRHAGAMRPEDLEKSITASLLVPAQNAHASSATFVFCLSNPGDVVLSVMDAHGRVIQELERGPRQRGYHSITWAGIGSDGRPVPKGTYRVRLVARGADLGERAVQVR